jgi:hypothetical protein
VSYIVLRTATWAVLAALLMLSVSLMAYEVVEKGVHWMRRLGYWTVATLAIVGMFLGSVAIFNGLHVHETRTSINAAVEAAMYADLMKKPTSPTAAKRDVEYAVDHVVATYQIIVRYHQVSPYEFALSASDGRGTNISEVCLWFNQTAKIWMPSTSACPTSLPPH